MLEWYHLWPHYGDFISRKGVYFLSLLPLIMHSIYFRDELTHGGSFVHEQRVSSMPWFGRGQESG